MSEDGHVDVAIFQPTYLKECYAKVFNTSANNTSAARGAVLMFALATALATAQERPVESMREGAPAVKRWGGWIPVTVGLWSIALAAFAGFFARIFPV